jgi:hypothetical protein
VDEVVGRGAVLQIILEAVVGDVTFYDLDCRV